MIDRQKLNSNLIEAIGKQAFIEILDIFLKEYEGKMSNLKSSIAKRNFGKAGAGQIGFDAHTIKSTSSYFFDSVPEEYLKRIIELDKDGVENGLDETLVLLEPAMANLISELKEIRKEYSR